MICGEIVDGSAHACAISIERAHPVSVANSRCHRTLSLTTSENTPGARRLFDFRFSKQIRIHDPALGLATIALKIAIVAYFLALAWNDVLYTTEVSR